jgi:phosphate transport system substrate-binding protein
MRAWFGMVLVLAGLVTAAACVRADDLKGEIKIDGSSTVYLISEAMATHFKKEHANVQVSVGISGTGGGFKKFMAGETDISDASRAIKPAEAEGCKKNGIDYVEFQVAWDGITVVIHPDNTWAKKMTAAQLKKIWNPDTPAKLWSDVDPKWPKEEIKLFGPGPDSGTFDYFTEAINGMEKVTRKDYEASQNPDVLVKGVAGSKYALGYFGLAYYEDNKDKLAAVAVAAKDGGDYVLPSKETVLSKTYLPLSRPLFIYVKKTSFKRPEVQEFVRFYLRRNDLVEAARYIQTTTRQRNEQQDKFEAALKELK